MTTYVHRNGKMWKHWRWWLWIYKGCGGVLNVIVFGRWYYLERYR